MVAYPFVARAWCAVCPFMIYGEWAQKVKIGLGGTVAHWPKARATHRATTHAFPRAWRCARA